MITHHNVLYYTILYYNIKYITLVLLATLRGGFGPVAAPRAEQQQQQPGDS